MYEDDSTPQIFDISPSQGASGTTVSINGSDFSTEVDDVTVTFGKSPCDVTFANESFIQCTLGPQSAGCYRVSVDIEGMGVASARDEVCFKYLAITNSVSPSIGRVGGGNVIKIFGKGFPRFKNYFYYFCYYYYCYYYYYYYYYHYCYYNYSYHYCYYFYYYCHHYCHHYYHHPFPLGHLGPRLSYLPWFRYCIGHFHHHCLHHHPFPLGHIGPRLSYLPSFKYCIGHFHHHCLHHHPFPLGHLGPRLSYLPWFRYCIGHFHHHRLHHHPFPLGHLGPRLSYLPWFRYCIGHFHHQCHHHHPFLFGHIGPLSYLPWFRYGIGLPALDITGANYFPFSSMLESLRDIKTPVSMNISTPNRITTLNSLKELVNQMYSTSPLKVQIGDTPCIIVESTISTITCIPLPASAGLLNVTVTVFNQSHVIEEAYTVSDSGSMTIQGISPSTGAVVGNSTVLITGSQFDSGNGSDIEVMIGGRPCLVQTVNSTQIQCSLPRMEPGQFPVFVSSTAGVALLAESLPYIPNVNISSLFPLFTYKLEITNASLSRGSSFGGTEVTLYGGTFVAGQTSVLVGNVAANVVSVSDSELKFITPNSSMTHSAGLSAQLLNTGE